MTEIQAQTIYFSEAGKTNTGRALALARARTEALHIPKALVASTTGQTGIKAVEALRATGVELIVVSHSTGFSSPNTQSMTEANQAAIEQSGARILTAQHAFGGVGRAVRRKLGTFQVDEIMAFTLRTFGQGMKVAAEMALMAADAGLVRTDEPVLAIAGSGGGADTVVVLRPANTQDFFDLRFLEIVCMPAPGHPGTGAKGGG